MLNELYEKSNEIFHKTIVCQLAIWLHKIFPKSRRHPQNLISMDLLRVFLGQCWFLGEQSCWSHVMTREVRFSTNKMPSSELELMRLSVSDLRASIWIFKRSGNIWNCNHFWNLFIQRKTALFKFVFLNTKIKEAGWKVRKQLETSCLPIFSNYSLKITSLEMKFDIREICAIKLEIWRSNYSSGLTDNCH